VSYVGKTNAAAFMAAPIGPSGAGHCHEESETAQEYHYNFMHVTAVT